MAVASFVGKKTRAFLYRAKCHRCITIFFGELCSITNGGILGAFCDDAEPVRVLLAIAALCEVQECQGLLHGFAVSKHIVEKARA